MIAEVTRLLDRWLGHEEYGVGAMLLTVPRLLPDGSEDDLPDTPTLYNDMEDEDVAADLDPAMVPALVIAVDGNILTEASDKLRQKGTVVAAIAYVTRDEPPLKAARDGSYVLRAVRKSLTKLNDQRASLGYRDLNGIKVLEVQKVTVHRVAGAVGASQLWGFAVAEVLVMDTDV